MSDWVELALDLGEVGEVVEFVQALILANFQTLNYQVRNKF